MNVKGMSPCPSAEAKTTCAAYGVLLLKTFTMWRFADAADSIFMACNFFSAMCLVPTLHGGTEIKFVALRSRSGSSFDTITGALPTAESE
jgi:hypothetical protein